MKRSALLVLVLLALAGCSPLAGRPQPVVTHVLTLPPAPATPAGAGRGSLILAPVDAPDVHQALNLIYSRSPGTLAQYQYARWSDLPPRAFAALLRQRLAESGQFQAVAGLGAGVRGDWQLNVRLAEFHHDAATPPGNGRVVLDAELVDRRDGRLVDRRVFRAEAPAPSFDAAGAARALGEASGRVLDDLATWLARVRPAEAR
ncbi:MAG: ABC-type transport auxiliary lipoprotein family protein [Pseudomonadota bacterium]